MDTGRNNITNRMKRKMTVALIAVFVLSAVAGCGGKNSFKDGVKLVFTTGFDSDEVFRIDKSSCRLPEAMVYLTNVKNQYEVTFGSEIWQASYEGETLEENIKETVLAYIARIKALNLLAKQHKLALSDEELANAKKAAETYYASLKDVEKELLGVDEKTLCTMYEEYALSEKVYAYLIADINPEISDDEARTITVQYIMIKTYSMNEAGERVPYSQQAKNEAYQKAKEALGRAKAGEDFTSLIAEYNEDSNSSYSFGKGSMDASFEEAAFNLGTDEISGIVETDLGYHIIKCISTFDRDETDRNKVKIVEERRRQVFNEEYTSFVENLTRNINQELWDNVGFIENEEVVTCSFFEIYQDIFS